MDSTYEIIYVNDGSTDSSYDVLNTLRTIGGCVKVVDLTRNFGQSSAVLAAFSEAAGDVIVTIDADLENHPEDIPALVAAVRNGADLACGVRGRRQAPLFMRSGPSWLANQLVGRALSVDLEDWGCGLNAVTSEVVHQMLAQVPLPSLPKIEAAIVSSCISQVPVAYSERQHGSSGYTVWRLCGFAAAFLQGFSITRTFRRIVGVSAAQARLTCTAISIICWAVLTIAAIVVRFGLLVSGSGPTAERYQIREVLE